MKRQTTPVIGNHAQNQLFFHETLLKPNSTVEEGSIWFQKTISYPTNETHDPVQNASHLELEWILERESSSDTESSSNSNPQITINSVIFINSESNVHFISKYMFEHMMSEGNNKAFCAEKLICSGKRAILNECTQDKQKEIERFARQLVDINKKRMEELNLINFYRNIYNSASIFLILFLCAFTCFTCSYCIFSFILSKYSMDHRQENYNTFKN